MRDDGRDLFINLMDARWAKCLPQVWTLVRLKVIILDQKKMGGHEWHRTTLWAVRR